MEHILQLRTDKTFIQLIGREYEMNKPSWKDWMKFFVPPDLAWGKRGAGDKIGAYATLIFDIRLERVRG
ncbi:MAG: FKBP-type peptidyl-prolyl cis-trans isomerase [Luteolibacter sp.]